MFTPAEAEQILREQWDDATEVGGFHNSYAHLQTLEELQETYGADALKGWTLIGETDWCDYEEGGSTYLFVKQKDQTLWSLSAGSNVYGEYGKSFDEIDRTTIEDWLETVRHDIEHSKSFMG